MIARIKSLAPLRLCAEFFSTPRSSNDYSTHLPILIGLARNREIKTVLEFGCGLYSTLTFLNHRAFPDLEQLHSIENDDSWAVTIQEAVKADERWTFKLIEGEIANSISSLGLEAFDLILVDDSKTSVQRAATIRAIAEQRPQRPLIAIHDYEVDVYRNAAKGFRRRHSFNAYNPHTGLVSNKACDMRTLNRVLKENRKILQPDDVEGWLSAFSRS